jgi:hypothetical protein
MQSGQAQMALLLLIGEFNVSNVKTARRRVCERKQWSSRLHDLEGSCCK